MNESPYVYTGCSEQMGGHKERNEDVVVAAEGVNQENGYK